MSFREFAKQYLNPFILFWRVCWLGMAAFVALVAHSGGMQGVNPLFLWGFAALLIWLALRRWKMASINDANNKLDELNQRYK